MTGDSFCNRGLEHPLEECPAGALVLAREESGRFPGHRILVEDPYLAYARISPCFRPVRSRGPDGLSPRAQVAEDAEVAEDVRIGHFSSIGSGARIGAGVVIGNGVHIGNDACIGEGTEIGDNVVVESRCEVGRGCRISPGAIIGASGFGYAPDGHRWQRIEQLGRVIIGDDVDIGASTTIDRGAMDDTVIGDGVKLDNQIHIAHNVHIGEHSIFAGCAAVAGSARIGKRCKIGGRGSIIGHLEIADDVTVMTESIVTSSIREAGEYGFMVPAQPAAVWRRNVSALRKLDSTLKKIKAEQRIPDRPERDAP